jgi:CRP-like cAMP-binding protein
VGTEVGDDTLQGRRRSARGASAVPTGDPGTHRALGDETLRPGSAGAPGDAGLATTIGDANVVAELRAQLRERTVVTGTPMPEGSSDPTPPPPPPSADPGDNDALARVRLFADLTPEAFAALVQAAQMVRLAAGEVAVEQDSSGDAIYAILNGRVRVSRQEGANRRELAILEAGAIFGEMAMVTGTRRSAWVVAEVDDTTLLQVPRQLLVDLVPANPSIATALASMARRRILLNLTAAEPLFAGLKRNERLDLIEKFEVHELARGEVLLGPRAELDGLFVLVSGEVEVRGPERRVPVGPVALLGDAAALSGSSTQVVVATTRSEVLRLPGPLAARLARHPSVASRMEALLTVATHRHQK